MDNAYVLSKTTTAPSRVEFESQVIRIFEQIAVNYAFGANPPSYEMMLRKALEISKYMFDQIYTENIDADLNQNVDHWVEIGRLEWS